MTIVYSDWDVIGLELQRLEKKSYFMKSINKMANSSFDFRFEVPAKLYLRGEVFCNDVEELSDYKFSQEDLIDMLHKDFMINLRKNSGDTRKMYKIISACDTRLELIRDGKSSLLKNAKMVKLNCRISREDALRIEYLLSEIDDVFKAYYAVEDILEILYCDFINELQKGNSVKVLNEIVRSWNETDNE